MDLNLKLKTMMMNNILLPDFIRAITAKCEFNIHVNDSIYNAQDDITTIYVCKTYHATVCSYLFDGQSQYEIIALKNNEWIQFNGDLSTIEDFTIKAPFFWQGTPLQVETVFANISNYMDKMPMIWLIEPYVSDFHEDPKSKIGYDAKCTLLFVLPILNQDDDVEEQYQNIIYPIDNLLCEFREFIRKSPLVENFNGKSKTVNRVNMGEWVSKGGARKPMEDNIKKLLDELITATEYSPEFSIKKNFKCCTP